MRWPYLLMWHMLIYPLAFTFNLVYVRLWDGFPFNAMCLTLFVGIYFYFLYDTLKFGFNFLCFFKWYFMFPSLLLWYLSYVNL